MRNRAIQNAVICLLVVVAVSSCRTGNLPGAGNVRNEAVTYALAVPSVQDVSGKLSVSSSSIGPLNVKVRMRWNESIYMSYSLLGLISVAEASFLPERVILVNSMKGVYCEMAYDEIPYSDRLKVDFQTIQGLFWGRAFVYGEADPERASKHLKVSKSDNYSMVTLTDGRGGFQFDTDGFGKVYRTYKSTALYRVEADYSGTSMGSGTEFTLPSVLEVSASAGSRSLTGRARYSSFMNYSGHPSDEVRTAGLQRVSADEMIGILKDLL